MNEMVERAARALVPELWDDTFASRERLGPQWQPEFYEKVRSDARLKARAMIAAMREPTQLMQDHGIKKLDELAGDNDVKREHLDEVWRTMIDAALAEGAPTQANRDRSGQHG